MTNFERLLNVLGLLSKTKNGLVGPRGESTTLNLLLELLNLWVLTPLGRHISNITSDIYIMVYNSCKISYEAATKIILWFQGVGGHHHNMRNCRKGRSIKAENHWPRGNRSTGENGALKYSALTNGSFAALHVTIQDSKVEVVFFLKLGKQTHLSSWCLADTRFHKEPYSM